MRCFEQARIVAASLNLLGEKYQLQFNWCVDESGMMPQNQTVSNGIHSSSRCHSDVKNITYPSDPVS